MEYCNGGSLEDCLKKYKDIYCKPFTEEIVQHIMRQVLSAINYIHDLGIINRYLTLDNILVKFKNDIDKNQLNMLKSEMKIIDFHFASYKDQIDLITTMVGARLYMDPITLNYLAGKSHEYKCDEKYDIWSLGVICYIMLLGNIPFELNNMDNISFHRSKFEEGNYKVPFYLSKEAVSFLNAMLQYKPEKRLSSSQLIKHPFLTKNISDFTKIDINKISKNIHKGEIIINIKDNNNIWNYLNEDTQNKLSSIPGELLYNETHISHISDNQYKGNLIKNDRRNLLIDKSGNTDKIINNNTKQNNISNNKIIDDNYIEIKKKNEVLKNRIKTLEIELEKVKLINKKLNDEINNYKKLYSNKEKTINNEINKEIELEKYPKSVTIDCTNKILIQMRNCICKIYTKEGGVGTGFFCKINYKNSLYPLLITNNHIIDEKYIKEKKVIKISLNDDNEFKDILFDNRKIYSSEKYDVTIIGLKPKDKINNFLEFDKNIFIDNPNLLYAGKSIYDIHYPKGEKLSVSYGIIKEIDEYTIIHLCNTETGSSGSPLLNLSNNSLIGIHKGGSKHFRFNEGTLLTKPILEFFKN